MKLLVIEGEPSKASSMQIILEERDYQVDVAPNGSSAVKLLQKIHYDVILLDVKLPDVDGIDLCEKIRAAKPGMLIILLNDSADTDQKISGFDAGADDYLVTPVEPRELIARINSLLKRYKFQLAGNGKLILGDLELDLDRKIARRSKTHISLTAKEFALLEYFMRNRGRVIGRMELSEKVWDITFDTGTNVVEVYVNILRKKIDRNFEPKFIHTRIGFGYMFTDLP